MAFLTISLTLSLLWNYPVPPSTPIQAILTHIHIVRLHPLIFLSGLSCPIFIVISCPVKHLHAFILSYPGLLLSLLETILSIPSIPIRAILSYINISISCPGTHLHALNLRYPNLSLSLVWNYPVPSCHFYPGYPVPYSYPFATLIPIYLSYPLANFSMQIFMLQYYTPPLGAVLSQQQSMHFNYH